MRCIHCSSECVKYGHSKNGTQRYLCTKKSCQRTFTESAKKNFNESKHKRLILHLLLAGGTAEEIAEVLKISKRNIQKWRKRYFINLQEILPPESLLSVFTMNRIYGALEKKSISKLNCNKKKRY